MYKILVIDKIYILMFLVPEQFAHQGPQGLNGEVLWHSFTDPDCQYQKSNNWSIPLIPQLQAIQWESFASIQDEG